jgi:lipoyl(octanoyl) transferase
MNELRTTNHELRTLRIYDCGLADYREVLELQLDLWEKRRQGAITDTVLIVEHPPVITLGARQSANKLLASPEELVKKGIDVVEVRRGGGTTAHNPGQLVFYPILNLQKLGLGVSEYIRELEGIGMELLLQLGVHSTRRRGFPGLWVANNKARNEKELATENTEITEKEKEPEAASGLTSENRNTKYEIPFDFAQGGEQLCHELTAERLVEPRNTRKIASIGVRVSKSVTYHGMAINIHNDIGIFDFLVPCGLDGVEMTSVLKETGKKHSMNEVKKILAILIRDWLSCEMQIG